MKHYTMPDPIRAARMNTAELRSSFLIEGLFTPGRLHLVSTDLDRAIVGGAVPLNTSLSLSAGPEMRGASLAYSISEGMVRSWSMVNLTPCIGSTVFTSAEVAAR